MGLSEKLVANRQKRNLMQMLEKLNGSNLEGAVRRQFYYPESGELLNSILDSMRNGRWPKKSYTAVTGDAQSELTTYMSTLGSGEKTMLCFFPNYSAQIDDVISDLPLLEVVADSVAEWYKLASASELHFFFCSSTDLRKGVALDVYEADPVVHGTAGAIFDLYYWNA